MKITISDPANRVFLAPERPLSNDLDAA